MGLVINTNKLSAPTGTSWSANSVTFTKPYAVVETRVNDSDPLHNVDIVFKVSVTGRYISTGGSTKSVAAGIVVATLDGYNELGSDLLQTPSGTANNTAQEFSNEIVLGTVSRGASAVQKAVELSIAYNNKTNSTTFNIYIPPYKQNIVNSNYRIVYTSNNVKYDLVNYK